MKNFKDMWEDAAANSVAGGGVSLPSDAMGKNAQKKKKRIYDGRTREGKKFVERILARRTASAEAKAKVEQKEVTEAKIQDLSRKHKRELQKAQRTGNLELSKKAEDDLYKWAFDNGEIKTDDPDEFTDWLDQNLDDLAKGKLRENVEEMKGADEWQEYAELLATKSRLIKKNNKPNSAVIHAINKKINVLLKKLGVTEQDAKLHLEALSKYDFRYYRTYELELKNRAYGYDIEQAFKKAGYDIYGGDISVRGPTIKFNRYSKKWGTDEKKLKAAIKKVLGIDVDRL